MRLSRGLSTAFLLFALTAVAPSATAAGIRISPVRLYLAADERAATVTVTNEEAGELRLQLQVERWRQDEQAADVLDPAPEAIANPPLFALRPGQSRVIRVGFADAPPADREHAYRVFIREVPANPAAAAEKPAQAPSGIQVLRRFSLPLFRAPTVRERRELHWTVERGPTGIAIRAHNRGNIHERRSEMKIYVDADNRLVGQASGINDLLPDAQRGWPLDSTVPPGTRLRIEATSDHQSGRIVEYVTLQ